MKVIKIFGTPVLTAQISHACPWGKDRLVYSLLYFLLQSLDLLGPTHFKLALPGGWLLFLSSLSWSQSPSAFCSFSVTVPVWDPFLSSCHCLSPEPERVPYLLCVSFLNLVGLKKIIHICLWFPIMNSSNFLPPKQKHPKFEKDESCVVRQLISFFLRKLVSRQSVQFSPTQFGCIYRGPTKEEHMISSPPQHSRQCNHRANTRQHRTFGEANGTT